MGLDDENVGGAGECPGHEFSVAELVLVREPGRLFPGLGMEQVCVFCGAVRYEPSQLERG